METIPKVDCTKIGFIRKTHGVQGEVVLEFESRFEPSAEAANRFFIELEGLLVPFFLAEDGFRFKSSATAILTFDWVESENYARRLVGSSVYLYNHEIVEDDRENDFDQFTGFLIMDKNMNEVGTIQAVDDYSGNIVFTVDAGGQEVLVPFSDELLLEIDEQKKFMVMDLPEGLFE